MKHLRSEADRQRTVHRERSNVMSSTATAQHIHQPVDRTAGVVSAAVIGLALVTLVGIVGTTRIRDEGVALQFDPSVGQRSHLVREYGADAARDPSGALHPHVLRENVGATAGALFDHVVRENDAD
jgi:hypothetical protein